MTITMGGGSGQILLSPFLRSQHKDPVMIGALVAVVAVASLAIRIPGGLLYSRTRARPLLLGSLAMCALAFSLYPVTANAALLAVIGMVYGTGFSVAANGDRRFAWLHATKPAGRRDQAQSHSQRPRRTEAGRRRSTRIAPSGDLVRAEPWHDGWAP